MVDTRIKISSIVENQLPLFVREEFPLVNEFLSQYYESLENQGAVLDILQNVDKYVKLEQLTNLVENTFTTSNITLVDTTINVETTNGFPETYGLLKIGSEIITYKSKTSTSFNDCVRGFSGVTSYKNPIKDDQLVFSQSNTETHVGGSEVINLSILFLKEFFKKIKSQFSPGFGNRNLYSGINQNLFIKQSRDFYSSKGTDASFEILFRCLYGQDVEVIKPRDYLFIPSNSQYRITKDLVVEAIDGNPLDLNNRSLFQDETSLFKKSSGSINNVEKIIRDNKEYFILSLDYGSNKDTTTEGSIFGDFSVHPQTKLITQSPIGAEVLDVDSTVGFPESGSLIADLDNGTSLNITYKSKSYTQFYGCSGVDQQLKSGQNIRVDAYAYGYSGIGTESIVKVRVTGVLSDLKIDSPTKYHVEGSKIKVKTLGKEVNDIKANNWIFNIATTYDVKNIEFADIANFSYKITTFDNHSIFVGNTVKLLFTDGTEVTSVVSGVTGEKSFIVANQGAIDTSRIYKIQKLIRKLNSQNFPLSNQYSTDVQNTYESKNGSIYVAASSLPSYLNESLAVKNKSVTFSGSFAGTDLQIGEHGFYTGDAIYYTPVSESNTLGIKQGTYYVKRVNSTTIKLSNSRSNLYDGIYNSYNATVTDNIIVLNDFYGQYLDNQKIIRNISIPQVPNKQEDTSSGPIGILLNGVEILNYKSKDKIFYGALENIEVLSPGSDYDVINPPVISISDTNGSGADGYCEVEGAFQEIRVIDGGFDYVSQPVITITGGNGYGAKASAQLIDVEHSVSFSAIQPSGQLDLSNNTIEFSSDHKFRDGEKVIYVPDRQQVVGGLVEDSTYYASIVDNKKVKLHNTFAEAISGSNPINLTSYGVGVHRFRSYNLKKVISSIIISDKGEKYRNRKISILPVGINTSSNSITAKNHGYSTGDVVVYTNTDGESVEGLSSGQSYIVTTIDKDSFRLSRVGTSTTIGIGSAVVGVSTIFDFYFNTNQYVDLISPGSDYHTFNYPPISVTVNGTVGVSTRTGQNFNATLQPIVRGEIKSVFLKSGGSGYGSEEIINFNRQPALSLQSGSGAEVIPIISNGSITEVLVTNPGYGYNSPPSFIISGPGIGAILTPIISNGSLSDVKVVYGGTGYREKRSLITVVSSGSGAKFQSIPTQWTINLVERNIRSNQVTSDDGFVDSGINSKYGLQYTHLYAPRKLRQSINTKKIVDGEIVYSSDLIISNNKEALSDAHSPIIGWAYDGNPIYGPYGYSSINGGSIKPLTSSYSLLLQNNRPSTSIYPEGFFVEDYQYQSNGDLDEHNGRFCVTPEFPNGVYAYFATINGDSVESSPPFRNYRKPIFPYFIGNSFKSKLNEFNVSSSSNQDHFNLNNALLVRNTKPYNLLSSNSGYDFIIDPNKIRKQSSVINYVKSGNIDSVGIKTGGFDYKVKDRIVFDNKNTGGQSASAEVETVLGKDVNEINVNSILLNDVVFFPFRSVNDNFIAFSDSPHNLANFDLVSITGINTLSSNLEGNYNIGVRTDVLNLSLGVGTAGATGIVTYFYVTGSLDFPRIRENDILEINSEVVKVLNIDPVFSRIRVLRQQDGSIGSAHTASTPLYEKSRKFYFSPKANSTVFPYQFNREIYFNPAESVGVGTSFGVGIGVTLFFNSNLESSSLFIPTRAVYLPKHNLNTGDKLIYSSNGGSPISISTDGQSLSQLSDNQTVYAAVINNDLIGISTNKVGLGSTGSFVSIDSSINSSILYFAGIGTGEIHSFTTDYENIIRGKVNRNRVTVSTSSTHGMNVNDSVFVSCLSGITTTYKVLYNDYHRRMVIDPKTFTGGSVDPVNDTIEIVSHGYESGQKVIHTSTSPCGGLENERIYFIIKIDNNKFKLAENYYDSTKNYPNYLDITSSSFGTLSLINPRINATKNQTIVFDVSDNSLSYTKNFNRYSSFKFNFYTDSLFTDLFESRSGRNTFFVTRNGKIGVDANASVSLTVTDALPRTLYYKLIPTDYNQNDITKLQIIEDSENVLNNNRIEVVDSLYSGSYRITGISSNTFSYNIIQTPERSSYISSEGSVLNYATNSLTAFGKIGSILVTSRGNSYKSLPGISSIITSSGRDAILEPFSYNIGKIANTEIQDIGFEYPSDFTLRPTAEIPQILKLKLFSSFDKIGISSIGKNYTIAPDLIVIDRVLNKKIDDIDLRYKLGDSEVSIFKNTKGINSIAPKIIPVNNSNGIPIKTISFNPTTKEVTVGLAVSYSLSSDYPFSVGDKVLIEGTSVGIVTSYKGYNSSSYNYELFTLTSIDPNIGGANGTVTFNLSNYLNSGENPGNFSIKYSSGVIIPEKFFPTFDIKLKKNQFFIGESVITQNSSVGTIESWNSDREILIVSSGEIFRVGDSITASSSKSQAEIEISQEFNSDAYYSISSSSIVKKGSQIESGFLNLDTQRLHDNDYYQYFSYSLKSKVDYEKWKDAVSSMNHTVGFKKFSDLILETDNTEFSGISTDQNLGDFTGVADLIGVIDLNCVNDFDLSTEKTLNIDSKVISDEVVIKSNAIQDYFESVGNRVLRIDDISTQFDSNPRPSRYSSVNLFNLEEKRSRKYIIFVADKVYPEERQVSILTLLHNDATGFLNQYGRVESLSELGYFDFNIFGTEGQIIFYPRKYEINDYHVNIFTYDIKDAISGIGTVDLGDTVKISSGTKTLPVGLTTTTTIVGIASTYRSSKLLIQYSAADKSYFEYDELTVIHNGTDVELLEYGQLSTNIPNSVSSIGIGTYSAYLNGSNLNIDLKPYVGLGHTYYVNSIQISIADASSTGVSTTLLGTGYLDSRITSIASTSSPVANVVCEYSKPYSCAYYVISLEDTTNNQYQVSEIIVLDDANNSYFTEFGILKTGSGIGSFGTTISGGKTQLTFTPLSGIDVQVRVFQNSLKIFDGTDTIPIDLNNAIIEYGYGQYEGTFSTIRRDFPINHRQLPIFSRSFVGNNTLSVDIENDLIKVPNHFFVTGEELIYSHAGTGTTESVGIATTSIVGFGTTDKLPSTVYAVKVDESSIRLASSVSNALKTVPITLDITSVGIGNSHLFTSKKQNSRVLVSIDNIIQSPIVSTSTTTLTLENNSIIDYRIKVLQTTSFYGGDLIKIDDEIMRVQAVGFGSTNVLLVKRPWMGTGIATHFSGSLVTKITGNYNIVDNKIHFAAPPYGRIPIGTTSGSANDYDYIGITTSSVFNGRSFMRSGIPDTNEEPYSKNYIFDDISQDFTGYTTSFVLKSGGNNISGMSTDNSIILINNIFQGPQKLYGAGNVNVIGDYTLRENSGITSIQFTGYASTITTNDINTSNLPIGGVLVSVASTGGFGYQPTVAAGGTAIVSAAGTISAISIGNSGSGYRSGVQVVRVGVQTADVEDTNITYIGIASISNGNIVSVAVTNPGFGYTSSNPPIVLFDSPYSYSNIPLVYSSSTGFGTAARANVVVGQGSSIIDFEIINIGYGYEVGEVLTLGIGGTNGIPTYTTPLFEKFEITVDVTYTDLFSGWSIGNLLVIDPLDSLFDGVTFSFPLTVNDVQKSIRSRAGSNIDVQETLLVFINDILQVPGLGYVFEGGSFIDFTEPPKPGDKSKILFYQGTSSVDIVDVDVLETIKVGDKIILSDDDFQYNENERIVTEINSVNSVATNQYNGPGISTNQSYVRPLIWCKQTEDLFISGKEVTKDRTWYEPLIYPRTNLIQSIGTGSTILFVESVKTFFDNQKENTTSNYISEIEIISQDTLISAAATAVVSAAGTISSIMITDGGFGYSSAPQVTISNPIGLGTTSRASAQATISVGGTVSSIQVTSSGTGYTSLNPPSVLIQSPSVKKQTIKNVTYLGDFGSVVGSGQTTVGVGSTGIFLDLFIPADSPLRNPSIVGTAVTLSGISTGDYLVITNSNIGFGLTSLYSDNSTLGIGSTAIDNIYKVSASSITRRIVPGIGVTYVNRITVNVLSLNGENFDRYYTGISTDDFTGTFDSVNVTFDTDLFTYDRDIRLQSEYYGSYSYGKILLNSNNRILNSFNAYTLNGVPGISTSSLISRKNSLRYRNYT
jgi:hypothetical protein